MRQLFCLGALCLSSAAFAYTNAFTLDFNTPANPSPNWTEVNGGAILVQGETAGSDSPAYPTTPQAGAGFNGTGFLRVGAGTQANGVVTATYDGTAGGSTAEPTNYTIESDVFIVGAPSPSTQRHQFGLNARVISTSSNSPLQFFYSVNTGTNANGYGFRNTNSGSGGTATTYGIFGGVTESVNRWVRMKISVVGTAVTVAVDRDLNGTYELSKNDIVLGSAAPTAGKAGVFSVINNGGAGAIVPNQYTYFDNFKYTPGGSSSVNDWSMY